MARRLLSTSTQAWHDGHRPTNFVKKVLAMYCVGWQYSNRSLRIRGGSVNYSIGAGSHRVFRRLLRQEVLRVSQRGSSNDAYAHESKEEFNGRLFDRRYGRGDNWLQQQR